MVDFYRKHGLNPGAAFYQCIGYLAARGSTEETKEIVQKIISINRRGESFGVEYPQRQKPYESGKGNFFHRRSQPPSGYISDGRQKSLRASFR